MSDTLECPYCEHDNDMTEASFEGMSNDNTFDWECSNCEREFEVHVEFEPSFTASEIEWINCGKCGEETRDIYERGKVFPFPALLGSERVCKSCWRQAYSDEMKSEPLNTDMEG